MEIHYELIAIAVLLLIIVASNIRASQEIFSGIFIMIIIFTLVGSAVNEVKFDYDVNKTAELKKSITISFN